MGFGGVGSMNIVMKNNRALLNKREHFKKPSGGYKVDKKPEYDFPEATAKTLRDIRGKMKRENRELLKKRMMLFSFLVVSLFSILVYVFLK